MHDSEVQIHEYASLYQSINRLNNCELRILNDFFDILYSEFNIQRVTASRNINSKGKKRGKISELLITNWDTIK